MISDTMWFKKEKGIEVTTIKREVPNGLWVKCEECGEILYKKELAKNLWICEFCNYHFKISARKYIEILTDEFKELDIDIQTANPLQFEGYLDKIKTASEKTGQKEAILIGEGKIGDYKIALGVMDFRFVGGSMGSVVGELVTKAIEFALSNKIPLIIINASGGARMQEGILSLMQMAKTSAALSELADAHIPYISILTNPTTAGVMASYASLGDVVIAEPKALLGFAGPRVIQQTIKQELPEGFQKAEFCLEHGLIDAVVSRDKLKKTLIGIFDFFGVGKEEIKQEINN
ncbi:MAG: acetyl-CoA carboxylase, carboxyltransferase subunit beta [bacterium]|nr:acetyl-CoA carboxylase, carboxyltransferase subunit beta [bacterium]